MNHRRFARQMFARLVVGVLILELVGSSLALAQTGSQLPFKTDLPLIGKSALTGTTADWPMAGANPQRTSWTPEEVRGQLKPVWYRRIEPYIPQKAQVIAANGMLYIATARGLYALDAATGADRWVFPTELPLGNSPTISGGVAYVGGFDRKLHAIDALTGQSIWAFEAGAGFDTNPLVVNGIVYAGNRDGYMYAISASGSTAGQLVWKYQTAGPVHFSAAYADGNLYFASDDSYAYALRADTGALVWRSAQLPGQGFASWWPVVYQNMVIFGGQTNYRSVISPGPGNWIQTLDMQDVFPNHATDPRGTLVGPRGSDGWLDASRITQYLEAKPWRRTYFVLDRSTGQEITYDFDGDGRPEYAPILWHGTHDGNRYPAIVGIDNNLYQANDYMSDPWIDGGQITGWRPGTKYISTPSTDWNAIDEPMAYSAGGRLVYWSHLVGASAGAFDITIPNTRTNDVPDPSREWLYYDWNLPSLLPGYNAMFGRAWGDYQGLTGSDTGPYSGGGDQNPPIPYQGKVYIHLSNAIIAFGNTTAPPVELPDVRTVAVHDTPSVWGTAILQDKLAAEVQKIIQAGHLRPGYRSSGLFDPDGQKMLGDNLVDYFHEPSDTLYTLLRAMPHLSAPLQSQVRTYLQSEFAAYPPYSYSHIGWSTGAPREPYILPPEVESDRANFPKTEWSSYDFPGWGQHFGGTNIPPDAFYALWKYALAFGNARSIFDASQSRLSRVPADAELTAAPHVHNAFIAGYWGYLELQKLAGYPEDSTIRATLNHLLSLRASNFVTAVPDTTGSEYVHSIRVSENFMNLVPELADYLRTNALSKVQVAVSVYEQVEPYWFVAKFEDTHHEGVGQPLYDVVALFQAKAMILREPENELERYLDVPAFAVGDLFYIQNLVSAIEATPGIAATSTLAPSTLPDAGSTAEPTSPPTDTSTAGATLAMSTTSPAATPPTISSVVDNRSAYPGSQIPKDGKLEITFNLNTVAQNLQMPYDPSPPPGVAPGIGVTVNGLFSPDNWQTTYTQPAFYYQDFDYNVKEWQDWLYPNGRFAWKVRFAPNAAGTWQYKLTAQDAGGATETQPQTFQVVDSSSHGFMRVSPSDPRYFEFADGAYFPALGYNMNFDRVSWNDPVTGNQSTFQTMSRNGIQLARVWLSQWSIFGSQDSAWRSPFRGSGWDGLYTAASGEVYPGSDTSLGLVWSTDTTASPGSPCMFLGWMKKPPAVKPNTSYHISLRYRIPQDIPGPNIAGQPYGLVAKLGGWLTDAFAPSGTWRPHQECAYPAAIINQISPGLRVRPITPYVSTGSTGWATLEGDFVTDANTTGAGYYLPYLYLALENVNPGPGQGNKAFIDQVEVRENLAGGQRGPSIIAESSMSRLQYFDQRQSYAFDQVLDLARQNGIYLKLTVLEKNEFTQDSFDYNGNPTTSESNDNLYGNWGKMTKVYWLQRAYWRYLQARWGYSPNVHSWELLNEGDPYSGLHYTLADNFAQYMHQFKPNDHLVTTSFWHSFPTLPFWQNASYSHLDYADVHDYVVKDQEMTLRVDKPTDGTYITIAAPGDYYDTAAETQKLSMQIGAQRPYGVGKPVMRGETGFVIGNSAVIDTDLWRDPQGLWLHNYIWGQINPGGLIESYWYEYPHIFDPERGFDHRDLFGKYYNFIKDVPLSNGHYQDIAATVLPAGLRVWGQKDLVNQRAHLWIANPQHTWKNVVDNVAIPALSGTITIGGWRPNTLYQVQWWDTYAGTILKVYDLSSNSAGNLTLPIFGLTSDTAVKIALASPLSPALDLPILRSP